MLARSTDDRILPLTRIVAGAVVPVLILAFLILYFTPERSGERFAWSIQPGMTAMFMGAGYLGGAWLFVHAATGRRWHRVAPGFLPVTAFTAAMLAATVLHWDRFDPGHFPFVLWLALYVITPFLIPLLWLLNRGAEPGTPEAGDVVVPRFAGLGLLILGLLLLTFAAAGFASPGWMIGIWPWALTPLTARVLSGWFALLGVGGIVIGRESRWSSWRTGLQSIGLWQLLVLAAAVVRSGDFPAGLANWYLASVAAVVAGMLILYVAMERRRTRQPVRAS